MTGVGSGEAGVVESYGVKAEDTGSGSGGNIKVTGGTLTGTGENLTACVFSYENGDSNITGLSYGIYAENNITVSDGELEGTGGDITMPGVTEEASYIEINSCGVYSGSDMSVQGGTLTGTGGSAEGEGARSYGVYESYGNITVSGTTGSISGTGGTATGNKAASYGVYVNNSYNKNEIIISGGSITGKGGAAAGEGAISCGVCAGRGGLTVNNGSVTGTGGAADLHTYGVYVSGGKLTVNGTGKVTGNGGAASGGSDPESFGVYAFSGLSISGNGSVEGTGGNAGESHGVHVVLSITVEGGTLKGKGGEAGESSIGVSAGSGFTVKGGAVDHAALLQHMLRQQGEDAAGKDASAQTSEPEIDLSPAGAKNAANGKALLQRLNALGISRKELEEAING